MLFSKDFYKKYYAYWATMIYGAIDNIRIRRLAQIINGNIQQNLKESFCKKNMQARTIPVWKITRVPTYKDSELCVKMYVIDF